MKVIEIRNLCLSYDKRFCDDGGADWSGLYVMKQILRNIQIKQLKNATNETELWVPENIVHGVDKAFNKIFEKPRKEEKSKKESRDKSRKKRR